jgi:hypothetical protein
VALKKFTSVTKTGSARGENFFSVTLTETAVNVLIFIVRYWKDGCVQDRVFDLIKVKGSSAQSIFDSIKNLLHKKHIPYENIIGFGADNAATMTFGHLGSVQVKLKELAPNIYIQGCLSHSLHLLLLKLQESCRAPLNNLLEMHMPTFHTPAKGLMS